MQARQRSLEAAVFRLSKAKRVSESSLSARNRVGIWKCAITCPYLSRSSKSESRCPAPQIQVLCN